MIARYTRPEMGAVWSEQRKLEAWLQVELAVVEALAEQGVVPEEDAATVRDRASFTVEAVRERERVTEHDVAAFVDVVAASVGEAGRWVHHGLTSSDVLDTALALQLVEATDLLLAKCDALVAALRDLGLVHRDTVRVGRTHGIHGEPDVWGHRVADFAFAMARSRDRLRRARAAVGVMAISGAVGTYSNIDPAVERYVAGKLGLRPADVSTQVVIRDGISEWTSALAIMATVCEAIALEVRHGQRTEVRELWEPFGKGQKGSSAMPHKKNPIISERLAGMARVVRGQVVPVMEGIPLWHERDISHSSTERITLPDASIALDYMLNLTNRLMSGLVVDAERMKANLESTGGLIYTSTVLLELVEAGMSRDDEAYPLVQKAAMETWETGEPFRDTLRRHAAEAGLSLDEARLDAVCRPERFVERLGPVFDRLAALT